MSLRFIQLGSPRRANEGTRIGIVRRPPRGVKKTAYASENWFDVWYPELAPSAEQVRLIHIAQHDRDEKLWLNVARQYRRFLREPAASRMLDLLAALSHEGQFSIGCYCAEGTHCHRSLLQEALQQRGADIVEDAAGATP